MRVNKYLGYKAAQTLYYAEKQAELIGLKLNYAVTINWTMLGIHEDKVTTVFSRMRHSGFSKWVTRPPKHKAHLKVASTYAYAFENCRDEQSIERYSNNPNVHVHWAVHVPRGRGEDFKYQLESWINDIVGRDDWPSDAVKVDEMTDHGFVRYTLKGAKPEVAEHFGATSIPQGWITGRRSGTTRNIGRKARIATDRILGLVRKVQPKPTNYFYLPVDTRSPSRVHVH